MSIIAQEVEKVLSCIVPPKAVFKLSSGYSVNSIKIENLSTHSCDSTSVLKDLVIKNIEFNLNMVERKYEVKQKSDLKALRNSVIYGVREKITDFIVRRHPSQNPRLTSLFQWFDRCVNVSTVDRFEGLEEMVFHTWSYIVSDKMLEKTHRENALKILEFIKTKFEAQGLKRND